MQRCHEELLERMAKKTSVKELEVSMIVLTALRHPYVMLKFTLLFFLRSAVAFSRFWKVCRTFTRKTLHTLM